MSVLSFNGGTPDAAVDTVKAAQQRLAEACMKQAMTPQGVAISAYINGVINGVGLQALIELSTETVVYETTKSERFIELLIKNLDAKTDVFEQTARDTPRIMQVAGHG